VFSCLLCCVSGIVFLFFFGFFFFLFFLLLLFVFLLDLFVLCFFLLKGPVIFFYSRLHGALKFYHSHGI